MAASKKTKSRTAKRGKQVQARVQNLRVEQLQTWIDGNIFMLNRVDESFSGDPNDYHVFTLRVFNRSGDWISVDVDRGPNLGVATTGHIENGQRGGYTEDIKTYFDPNDGSGGTNQEPKITRWRPGAFGIPGNGGGEIIVAIYKGGDVVIDIDVVG